MKFSHRIHIAVSALLLTWSAAGERSPLQRPGYSTDLGDTSKDYESYNAKSNHWVASDSYARASFDSATGTYHFRFKDNAGVWHEAHWMTNSSAEVEFAGSITRLDNNLLQYGYRVAVLPNSIRDLTRITIETASDVADPTGLGKLSAPERRKYWQTGEWVGRELSKSWGRRLWTWTRFLENLSQDERRKDSVLHLVSKGLPVTTSCWVQSDGGYLFSEYEPPYSLSRFHSLRNGILKDAATGLTIAPGLNSVQLPALKAYLDTSIEQGWLEAGEYLDQVKALLEAALQAHDSGNAAAVLTALKDLDALIEEVYGRKDSPILSEAYALFHFNIAYLLEHYKEDSKTTTTEPAQGPAGK